MGTKKRGKVPCLEVEVMRRSELWGDIPGDADLIRAAQAALQAVSGTANCEVSIVLSSDKEVRALNKNWRGRDEPTNVLSFPLGEPAHGGRTQPLGDVVLACETVMLEAENQGIELGQHSAHLVVHGVLHLLGYDHEIECEAMKMESLESKILKSIGLSDPYEIEIMRNGETK